MAVEIERTADRMLLIRIHFLDDRYHGEGDAGLDGWPPSPARLFQALLAGNAVGARLPPECAAALRWLESEAGPPEIRAQRPLVGLSYTTFVPNNDLDAKGGDPARIADIRVGKRIRPRHIESSQPLIYGWRFRADGESEQAAGVVCAMAENLYQLGRGVDMAWARAEILDAEAGGAAMDAACGAVWRPSAQGSGPALSCPQLGSLESLVTRFDAHRQRFSTVKTGRKSKVFFTNPPKPRFLQVTYNASAAWRLFDLRADHEGGRRPLRSWPQARAVDLVEQVRDAAAAKLAAALPEHAGLIERLLIGRGAESADKARRVRLLPLPSIGHELTNRSIRRLLVTAPPECPLRFGDLDWALSGLRINGVGAGDTLLVRSDDVSMLQRYGVEAGDGYKCWRSVTPVVLPESAARRRIDPDRRREDWKPGSERVAEEEQACGAVLQALRHAELSAPVEGIRVQREPFSPKGVRAEAFAQGTRFAKERLWHVEIRFRNLVEGPLVLGDGRYLGLGLLAPEHERTDVLAFHIAGGLAPAASPGAVAAALRRAVMARVQTQIGQGRPLPPYFTGHQPDGEPLRSGAHRHLAFVADLARDRLLVIPPHLLERRYPMTWEREHWGLLTTALDGMDDLRAGAAGRLRLIGGAVDPDRDLVFGTGRVWESVSDYRPTRHAKKSAPEAAVVEDVLRETRRERLPDPEVDVLSVEEGPRGGLAGRLRLRFAAAQRGPVLIGRTRHLGGGLFRLAD
jgi:CRISPR-associated protein Csb2